MRARLTPMSARAAEDETGRDGQRNNNNEGDTGERSARLTIPCQASGPEGKMSELPNLTSWPHYSGIRNKIRRFRVFQWHARCLRKLYISLRQPRVVRRTPIPRQPFVARPPTPTGPRTNRQIRVPEVRVIDADGQQIGVMSTDEAIRRAEEAGLDLIEVAATAEPPVCRIADLGKFKFESGQACPRRQEEPAHLRGQGGSAAAADRRP